ncbi:helix-turn-helix transcriptional regulator [Oceanicoccus sagamiensis]|uniref:HTH araC/xylS-type domain-containing protein n=1 Tax=Oceanicoccus sagamiensis TaxID=716816 RepID=A0A1X9N883_9GAMM|nr:helix-turn-helix transcriptional regulator [Oceanicoccus sagamiensis]ARN74270.1 hypothetical protein BST96_09135 [Oceanicoccus sagamiensis]
MEEQQPYLENELRIADLADGLGIASNHLSQILNQQSGQNFYEFVNGYRVAEAQRLLDAPDLTHLTMVQVAMEAGFNSQSAFYKHFKNTVGVTPAQYRRQL